MSQTRIEVTWGATWQGNVGPITWPDEAPAVYDIVWVVKRSIGDSDDDAVILKRLSDGGIASLAPEDGTAQLQLDPSDYVLLEPGQETVSLWGLYLTTDTARYALAGGLFRCKPAVWRGTESAS